MSKPFESAIEFFHLTVADCKTVDKDVLVWVLAEALTIIVDGSVKFTSERSFEALLLPELDTVHIFDVLVEF